MTANRGRGGQGDRHQGKRGEFESGEPSTVERPELAREGRNPRTGEPEQGGSSLPQEIRDALSPFSEKYHEYHERTTNAGTKKNPLYDARMTPERRFEKFLESEWNTFGKDIKAALKYAIDCFEDQGEDIAGAWAERPKGGENKDNVSR